MSSKLKKILSVLIVALVIFGIYVSIFGIGSIENLKKSLDYGLDIDGGVNVVMQAYPTASSGYKFGVFIDSTNKAWRCPKTAMRGTADYDNQPTFSDCEAF